MAELLLAQNIRKAFGGVQALDGVGICIEAGTVHGLIGPNGAGKTTLFNVLTGLYRADTGSIRFGGRELVAAAPDDIVRSGIARTFQNIRLFGHMSALENVMVGRHIRSSANVFGAIFRTAATRAEEAAIRRKARELLDYAGLGARAGIEASALSYGEQRRLEIARALATEPRLLALDEPAAGMNATETEALAALVRRIRADGVTVLLIEHDMPFVMNLCEHITVLDHGKVIADDVPDAVRCDPLVIEAYLGADAMPGTDAAACPI